MRDWDQGGAAKMGLHKMKLLRVGDSVSNWYRKKRKKDLGEQAGPNKLRDCD